MEELALAVGGEAGAPRLGDPRFMSHFTYEIGPLPSTSDRTSKR